MHWLDLSLLALFGLGAALGFWSGLIMQIARLICLAVSIYATLFLNETATRLLHERVAPDAHINLLRGISYVGVFLIAYLILFALSRLVYRVVRATKFEMLDRLAGAALGAIKMVLLLAPACALLTYLALPPTEEWMSRSTIAPMLAKGMHVAVILVPETYKNQAQESVDHVRARLQGDAVDKAFDLLKIEEALKKK
jgi:uncharacterized membrane protein required for colicin V production